MGKVLIWFVIIISTVVLYCLMKVNWLNGRLSCEQIEQLWCEFIIPEQNKEQKESEE